ncbi:MAG: hypothetical protein E7L17_10030 [Clostridium sp.]|uniref:hypothetical protein n=1 Tax=Clostridium sp. TaxID=1506 RepID=UPI002913635A|nr:hypothetical protein [Clostridium sp.]MDU7338437.1 hypothetical protein [Clostridium sp.]
MKVELNGFGEKMVTFEAAQGIAAGMPVMMSANGKVAPCAAGKLFCGIAGNVRGEFAAVQLSGYVKVPYSGTAPAVGYQSFSGDGTGKVKVDSAGRPLLVVDVDTATAVCGIIL